MQKSYVIHFKILLEFVPTIFVFSPSPLDSPDGAMSSAAALLVQRLRQNLWRARKREFYA